MTVLSNQQYRFLIAEQLLEIGASEARIVLEPANRNTAPAACIAALLAIRSNPDAVVLLAPSDQVITDTDQFTKAIAAGIAAVGRGLSLRSG